MLADRAALDELRATAEEDTALGLLALGEHAAVLAATEQSAARHPLRERTRSLQALALVRTGRQVEALEVLRGYRELLADELGLDPGPEVRALEEAVLRQSPALGSVAAARRRTQRARPESAAPTPRPGPLPCTLQVRAGSRQRPARSGIRRHGRPTRAGPGDELGDGRPRGRAGGGHGGASRSGDAQRPEPCSSSGDPGTGKTRLVDDALTAAAGLGLTSAVGRCSQDDGAPPLWPWYALLDGLGIERPPELARTDGADEVGPGTRLRRAGRPRPGRAGARRATSRSSSWSRTCTGPTPARCGR